MVGDRKIRLSPPQRAYLLEARYLPDTLWRLLLDEESGAITEVLELDPSVAEEFRTAFTMRLAEMGFDAAYEPTQERILLESLLDAFLCELE